MSPRPPLEIRAALFLLLLAAVWTPAQPVRRWTTTEDLRLAFAEDTLEWRQGPSGPGEPIDLDPGRGFQFILGIGSSLEPTTCSNLFRMLPAERARVMEELVSPASGIGMNLMRICIGTPDFTGDDWHSCNDLPPGGTDPELRRFSIERDRAYVLPVLKLAREKNSDLLFFASPWSPPGWMKTTGSMIGGELRREFYPVYARYFVRFIQAYQAEGIPIHAVTVQNEPGVDRSRETDPKWFYPSCRWTAEQERDFIRDHLGPAFRQAGLNTRIWCYDHNYNVLPKGDSAGLDHPRAVLRDLQAAGFVDGVAFHHYDGDPTGMTIFRNEFPDKPVHFTEGSVFSIYGGHDLIERFRNWAVSYNAWVTILDQDGQPNRGPFPATTAILRFNSASGVCEKLLEFYNYGHFSRFIQRGARRIYSPLGTSDFNNVAFLNPDGSFVVILVNTTGAPRTAVLRLAGKELPAALPAKAIATLRWAEVRPDRRP